VFLRDRPHGTVADVGAGLSSWFDGLDTGTVQWFDLGLPDFFDVQNQLAQGPKVETNGRARSR